METVKISKLQVTNFRNLSSEIIEFSPNINCIFGENGNGKTNILEAIYVIANRKSFRKNTGFPQYLSMDGEKPEIIFSSVFNYSKNLGKLFSYSGKMRQDSSEWFLDGRPAKKKADIHTIFITPFDSYEFHNQPSFRRTWFDRHISMVNKDYKKALGKYNTSLKFRNALLSKRPSKFREQIQAIDPEIAKNSVLITNGRLKFLEDIGGFCTQTFKDIFSKEHILKLSLDSKIIGYDEDTIHQLLQTNLEEDIISGRTRYGVHRDDYVLLFDGLNSYDYCSLGQQKMSYLSLSFAYINFFKVKLDSYPIVLIDDVSGELDQFRWRSLVGYLNRSDFQVIITTANDGFREELEKIVEARKIAVRDGCLL